MTLICSLLMIAISLLTAVAIYAEEDIEEDLAQDLRLQHVGRSVMAVVEMNRGPASTARLSVPAHGNHKPDGSLLSTFRVWTNDGELLFGAGKTVRAKPIAPLPVDGLVSVDVEGKPYRVMTVRSSDRSFVVQAEEPDESVWTAGNLLAHLHLALPLAFVPVLAFAWWMMRRTIQSVNRLTDQMRRFDPAATTRLEHREHAPAIEPMANALDDLINRIAHVTSAESSLRAAVAHEMRGSLAGIRAQAQLARSAQVPDELNDALGSLIGGADRAARMLDQILDLARVDGMTREPVPHYPTFRFLDVYLQVEVDLKAKAEAKRITLAANFDANYAQGDSIAFYMLLRNLLENAILYGPPDGRIEVRTSRRAHVLVLTVDDSGPGIPVAERPRAFERFNRLGKQDSVGVGLGLWIVKRIVELHGGSITLLDSPLGGLRVEIAFEMADTASSMAASGPVGSSGSSGSSGSATAAA